MQAIKKQGGALLTALFIMTLVAIVATAMSTRLQIDIYRTRLVVEYDKLYMASQAVTFWALDDLNQKKVRFTSQNKQGLVDNFPGKYATIYNQVKLAGALYDLQGRFNLNNLSDKKYIPVFIKLLGNISPGLTNIQKKNLALEVGNWVSEYDLEIGEDLYTSYYLSLKPAYYPSHQLIKNASEFRLLKDVSAQSYLVLQPFITALPEVTPININSASKQVIMSLGNGLTEAQADELLMFRGEKGIANLKDINELLKKLNISKDQISIESKYFLNIAYASTNEYNLSIYTLIKREQDKKGTLTVSIIEQSINDFQDLTVPTK